MIRTTIQIDQPQDRMPSEERHQPGQPQQQRHRMGDVADQQRRQSGRRGASARTIGAVQRVAAAACSRGQAVGRGLQRLVDLAGAEGMQGSGVHPKPASLRPVTCRLVRLAGADSTPSAPRGLRAEHPGRCLPASRGLAQVGRQDRRRRVQVQHAWRRHNRPAATGWLVAHRAAHAEQLEEAGDRRPGWRSGIPAS